MNALKITSLIISIAMCLLVATCIAMLFTQKLDTYQYAVVVVTMCVASVLFLTFNKTTK